MSSWKHGLHWMRDDHYHGMCISCGAAADCVIEPGWPDCADMCEDCRKGSEAQKTADSFGNPITNEVDISCQAHGAGQESALEDVAEYLDLVARELVSTTDEDLAASLIAGLASSLRDGSWHAYCTELRERHPKQQSSGN